MEFFSSSDLLSSIYYQIAKVALVKAVVFTSEIVSGIMKKKIGNRFINLCILAVMVVGVIKAGEYYRKDEYKLDASLYKLSGISRNVSPLEVGKIWRQ
jgi:hypothetical protein